MLRHIVLVYSAVLLLALAVGSGARAESVSELKPHGFVNDFAQVIDPEQARQIDYLCSQVEQKANAQIAVVTIHSLDGTSIETFATSLFRQWGIGPRAGNRGMLILLAVEDRRYRIGVGTGLEAIVTDRKAADFGRDAVPYLKKSQYGQALYIMTRRVADALAADANVTVSDAPLTLESTTPVQTQPSTSSRGDTVPHVLIVIVAGVFVAIIAWVVIKVVRKPGNSGVS